MEIPPTKEQILQSIKNLLEKVPSPARPQSCGRCGSAIHFINTHFLLHSTATRWNVPLPFCPVCDREILENLPCRETIH